VREQELEGHVVEEVSWEGKYFMLLILLRMRSQVRHFVFLRLRSGCVLVSFFSQERADEARS
jgi:hypothetical protein